MKMVIDIILSLALVYALFSILCTSLVEWIGRLIAHRSECLRRFLKELLQDDKIWAAFQDHPCIRELAQKKKSSIFPRIYKSGTGDFPSYIPDKTFALVLINLTLTLPADRTGSIGVKKNMDPRLAQLLKTILAGAESVSHASERIQQWYNESQQRVTGQYIRRTSLLALAVAVLITIVLNVDSLSIAHTLKSDRDLRARVASEAQRNGGNNDANTQQLGALKLPIGWAQDPILANMTAWAVVAKLFGWIVSIIAIQLGAPFWFDLLKQFVNIRQAAAPPVKP